MNTKTGTGPHPEAPKGQKAALQNEERDGAGLDAVRSDVCARIARAGCEPGPETARLAVRILEWHGHGMDSAEYDIWCAVAVLGELPVSPAAPPLTPFDT
ncbi:hypothetical protein [Yunchengibacter salinarum]|uniref:hypothetical protein n=1 Tax=Yunchengibacter salinarum TaxID=3133399 RepID=UPI0035B5AD8C